MRHGRQPVFATLEAWALARPRTGGAASKQTKPNPEKVRLNALLHGSARGFDVGAIHGHEFGDAAIAGSKRLFAPPFAPATRSSAVPEFG